MAGDWIKMRADLCTHPKVDQLAQILKVDELTAVGALFCFWAWADKHAVDGRVDAGTSRLVDRAVRLDGLAEALITIGWLVIDRDGLTLPRFEEHNGDSAKERSLKNQRQARWRERKAAGLVVDAEPSTPPSTREEKRREDKEREPAPKGTRLPTDWKVPPEWAEWAWDERPDLDITETAKSFADYWHGVAGAKGVKLDWIGTWRNWVRRQEAPRRHAGSQVRLAGGFVG